MENSIHIKFRLPKRENPDAFQYFQAKLQEIENEVVGDATSINMSKLYRKYFLKGIEAEIREAEEVAA